MQQHASTYSILPHTLDPWGGIKDQNILFSLKVVMLYIKLMRMWQRAPCKYIFCLLTHPQSPVRVKRSKLFFAESSHDAYLIKGNGA